MVFCGKCGTDNPDGNSYCGKCGSPLQTDDTPPVQPPEVVPEPQSETDAHTDFDRMMDYRVALIAMGIVMCAAVLIVMYYVDLSFDIYVEGFGNPVSTGNFTIWELFSEGFDPFMSMCVVLTIILALLSVFNYMFSFGAIVMLFLIGICNASLLKGVNVDFVQVGMVMDGGSMGTLIGICLGLLVLALIPLYIDYKFSEICPSKGIVQRMSRIWKL